MGLKNRTIEYTTKKHYISNTIQNELIDTITKTMEKELLLQLAKAKFYALSLNCTQVISHKKQMTVILPFVQCDEEDSVTVKEFFLDI